jgi:hypothetical protein
MSTTYNAAEFRRKWHNHIDQLEALKLALPPEQMDEVDEVIFQASKLVNDAAENAGDE